MDGGMAAKLLLAATLAVRTSAGPLASYTPADIARRAGLEVPDAPADLHSRFLRNTIALFDDPVPLVHVSPEHFHGVDLLRILGEPEAKVRDRVSRFLDRFLAQGRAIGLMSRPTGLPGEGLKELKPRSSLSPGGTREEASANGGDSSIASAS
jgi:hypothetical protein